MPKKSMKSGISDAVEVTTNMLTHGRKIASATADRPIEAPSGIPTRQAAPKPSAICRRDPQVTQHVALPREAARNRRLPAKVGPAMPVQARGPLFPK